MPADPPEPTTGVPDLLPARMLNEFTYCPRLFYLEWVQGEFADSADTVEGRRVGRRTSEEKGALAPAEACAGEPEVIHARSVHLSSERLGLTARMDLIEGEGRRVTPVEYKKGEAPDIPEGAWEPERVQVAVQALILRDAGYQCDGGVLYFAASKKRVPVPLTPELAGRTLELAGQARALAASGQIPPPLLDSPKCPRCSLVGICLPDEVNALLRTGEGGPGTAPEDARRLFPARDDAFPVHVQEQGARVTKDGDLLTIHGRQEAQQVRLLEVSQLCLYGNVGVTTQVVRALCERGIPVCYFTYGGWFYGITHGMSHKNVELRQRQYAVARNKAFSARLARQIVEGKIRNCRTLLRRNAREPDPAALEEMGRLAGVAAEATTLEALLGIEGAAAQVYFANFAGMLKAPDGQGPPPFDFRGRNRRPPGDPVNALLSFLYAVLAKDLTVTLLGVGFDPYLGLYHQPKYGRPALALDLMEEFRPLVADSTVLTVINNGEVAPGDFVQRGNACALTERGRKAVLKAYERRLDTLVRHPVFGYTISYRRVLEVQARLLGRAITGEIEDYPAFVTR